MIQKRNKTPLEKKDIESMAAATDLPNIFAELLLSRGLNTKEKIEEFLNPETAGFLNPFLMMGMREAAERIESALKNNERILIYSDYDADGICSSAILSLYFSKYISEVFVHIPGRNEDGYGLNISSLERITEEINPDLIVTCDCGISCVNEVDYVLDLGIDVIVTDHHSAPEKIPACTVVNPHQSGCEYPFKELCGAGVAFKLIQALDQTMGEGGDLNEYLDLAAVATVADLVSLVGENRLIVSRGLKQLNKGGNLGLRRLIQSLELEEICSADIAFKIAPRINAAGRMGDASRAFDLVTLADSGKVDAIIAEIEKDNEERRRLCDQIYAQALAMLSAQNLASKKVIVLHGQCWEKGVTGIVAARLGGEFKRPCILIAGSGDSCKGTARSIEGINIYDIISAHSRLLVEFGGHSQAAGFSIDDKNVAEFRAGVEAMIAEYDDSLFLPKFYYDCDILEREIDRELLKALKLLEPTGHSNYKPLFCLETQSVKTGPCKNSSHTQITTQGGFSIFAFYSENINQALASPEKKQLVVELKESAYNGSGASGILRHCESPLYIDDGLARAGFLRLVNFRLEGGEIPVTAYEDLSEAVGEGIYGTILIAGSKKTYEKTMQNALSRAIILTEAFKSRTKNNYNRLIVSPDFSPDLPLEFYERVVFLDSPPAEGCLRAIAKRTAARIFVPKVNNFEAILAGVDFSRETFGSYFGLMKQAETVAPSLTAYFNTLKNADSGLNMVQFMVCLSVFVDLGLVAIGAQTGKNDFIIKFDTANKCRLEDSRIYNYLKSYSNP